MKYFLGLGTNLGDLEENLARALSHLARSGIAICRTSSVYRTEPFGVRDQPWFLNQAVEVETELAPEELLGIIQGIEERMGRRPDARNAPRIIDIDILLAGSRVLESDKLILPHPRLTERNFVLIPLAEIAADVVHPVLKKSIRELRDRSADRSIVSIRPPRKSR